MIKRNLIYLGIFLGEIIIVNFTWTFFLDFTFKICTSCTFIDNIELASPFRNPLFFAITYSLIGLYLNFKTMKEFKSNSSFAIIGLTLMDILLIQVSMILSLAYFRTKGLSVIGLKEIFNPLFMIFIVSCKHIIALAINDFIIKPRKK